MKKYLPIMVLAAALAVPMTASAEITVTSTGVSLSNADWIDGSDLLRVEQDAGYAIADVSGNLLTDAVYGRSFSSDYGFIFAFHATEDVNSGGLLNADAQEITPFQYGDVKVLSRNWAIGFKLKQSDANHYDYQSWSSSDAYYLIDTADVYYIADGTASCIANLTREQYMRAEAYGDYISIEDRTNSVKMYDSSFTAVAEGLGSTYDTGDLDLSEFETFRENGQYGLMDKEGNVLLEPSFAYIYDFRGDYAEVSTGDLEGLIDRTGKVVVPAEYDSVKSSYYGPVNGAYSSSNYYNGGYFAVEKDRKLGFVNENGEVTCEPKISIEVMDINGASALYTDLSGDLHILAADGVDTLIDASKQNVYPLSYGSGLLYRYTDENYNYGVIDWHGQEILPCEYDDVELSGSGNYMIVAPDWNVSDIYTVNYGDIAITASFAAEETPAEAAPADAAQTEAAPADAAQTEAAPADAAQTEAAPADAPQTEAAPADAPQTEAAPADAAATGDVSLSAAADLLKSAADLISADAAANSDTIASLLNSAAVLVESSKPEAAAMIRSAVTLITSGVTDSATLTTLLNSAAGMLG